MEKISIAEILSATGGVLISGNTDETVSSVVCDSRKAVEGSLFVPLIGENVDGHDFINKAFENGAAASLIQSGYETQNAKGPLIEVNDTLEAMQDLAAYYRRKFDIPVIAVTGSVGKTTTKEMIASVLGSAMKVFKTEGNYNGQIGLPLTIFNLDSSYEIAVFELGVSKFGEMEKLAKIADPNIGVVTNIGMSHLENFKTIENTCSEKLKILQNPNGILYLNGDCPILSKKGQDLGYTVVYFGVNGDYPYKCQDIYSKNENTTFTLVTSDFKENISIPCLGIHNVYNALAAIGVALKIGIHLDDIKKGLSSFKNVGMRQQISNLNGITIIDDSYNASPDSMKSAITVLKSIGSGRKIVVMADMLELGGNSENAHYDIGRYMAIEGVNILITVGNLSQNAAEGIKSTNQEVISLKCSNNSEAFDTLKNIIKTGDKILVKGSRGMHTEEIVQNLKNYLTAQD